MALPQELPITTFFYILLAGQSFVTSPNFGHPFEKHGKLTNGEPEQTLAQVHRFKKSDLSLVKKLGFNFKKQRSRTTFLTLATPSQSLKKNKKNTKIIPDLSQN